MHTILVGSVAFAIFAGIAFAVVSYLTRRESRFERDHRLMIDVMRPVQPPRSTGPAPVDVPRLFTDGEMDASGLTVIDPIADYRARATPEELASLDVTAVYPSAHPLSRRVATTRRADAVDRRAHGYDSSGSGFNDPDRVTTDRVPTDRAPGGRAPGGRAVSERDPDDDGSPRQDVTLPGRTKTVR